MRCLGSRTALVGLGGVGKSQLAIEYAYRIRDLSSETWVFWVHASNAARFEQSFRDIADCVKIFGRQNPQANIFQLVHNWLRDDRKGRWVLMLDNVDDASFLIQAPSTRQDRQINSVGSRNVRRLVEYLPHCSNGSILITSRSTSAVEVLVEPRNIIAVGPKDRDDALVLFEKKLGKQDNSNDTAELVEALEFIPLAIVQAAVYIFQRKLRSSVHQYLHDFRKNDHKRTSLLNHEGKQPRRDWDAKNSIIITWQISFNDIREIRPSAADLLSLMSFFDRQGIPEALLQSQDKQRNSRYSDSDEDNTSQYSIGDGFEEDVLVLQNYSFISTNTDGTAFEIHRLVQLATREWLRVHEQQEKWKQQFIKNLDSELPAGNFENWAKFLVLFPHAQSAAAVRQPEGQDSLRDWASVLYKTAWYACTIGKWVEAEKMSVQAMKVRERTLGQEHNDTLWSMSMVSWAYRLRGRWDAAEKLDVQVMETRKKKLGADHPSTLTSMANLASTFWNQGRWDAAEELDVQVMETRKKKLGADHPSTLTSMANLASTFWNQGRWDAAEELDVQVMETRKKKLGADHPSTLTSMANLASTYRNQGRWDAAEELFVQVIETRKKKLGADHPDTLTSMANLAFTWKETRKETEALRLMEECVQLQKRILGINHPHSISSCTVLDRWKAKQEGVVLSV